MVGMEEQIKELVEEIKVRTEKVGLYLKDFSMMTRSDDPDIQEKISKAVQDDPEGNGLRELAKTGEVQFIMVGIFQIGDVAFGDRVQNPDAYDADKQFAQIVPSEDEMIRERIMRAIAEGKDPLSIFDDEDDEDA